MKVVELGREDTLSIPGIEAASLEYLRREDSDIMLRNGVVLSRTNKEDGNEAYLLIGAQGDVDSILNNAKISN